MEMFALREPTKKKGLIVEIGLDQQKTLGIWEQYSITTVHLVLTYRR